MRELVRITKPGGSVLVLGLGAVGLCAVRCALALGAATVYAYDPVEGRRHRAVEFGGAAIGDDTIAEVMDVTGGRGVDVVIDAVATDRSLDCAFGSVKAGGTISVVGVHDLNPYPMPILTGGRARLLQEGVRHRGEGDPRDGRRQD